MPRLGTSEEAFLSLVKSLHKGKGKENVPTDIRSLAQSYGKIKGNLIAPPLSDVVKDAPWPDHRPTTLGAQEEALKPSPLDLPPDEEKIFAETVQPSQSPTTYTVMGSNFAPETTAADIEAALSDEIGPMQHCHIISEGPVVEAEMVFTEKSHAEDVIAAYDNKKADGYLLRFYMKPENANTPSTQPYEVVESEHAIEGILNGQVQSAHQPPSPILRGRGTTRFMSLDGPIEQLIGDGAAVSVEKRKTDEVKEIIQPAKVQDEEMAPKDSEGDGVVRVEGESEGGEADARARHQSKEDAGAQARKTNELRFTEDVRTIPPLEEDPDLQTAIIRALNDYTKAMVGQESVNTGPSATATANGTKPTISAAVEVPVASCPPSLAPTADEATAQPSTNFKPSSMPLLSSGKSFFDALSKQPVLPRYTSTTTNSAPKTPSSDDVLPDELPAATITQPDAFNRSSSPLAQINTTGTLQTPTGEHTIHLDTQPPSKHANTAPKYNSTTQPNPESLWDVFPQYRPNPNPLSEPLVSPSYPTPNHSDLPPRRPRDAQSFPPAKLPPRPLTSKNQTLTLLSGSGPSGRVCKPRRYDRTELIKIGKAYQQKVFLALLGREGRGRLVIGITEGV